MTVVMPWVQEISKKLIDNQYAINYNTSVSFVEALKRFAEDTSSQLLA